MAVTHASNSLSGEARPDRRGRSRLHIRRLLIVALLTYLGVCVVLSLLQSRLIFFPTRDYPVTPADVGLRYEELTLRRLSGYH